MRGEAAETKRGRFRKVRIALALAALVLAVLVAKAWRDTMAEPVVRRTVVALAGLPPGTRPIRAVLLSDIHVAGPDMPPERVARIVRQLNALHPDLVLIAGDFVSDRGLATRHYSIEDSIAPLGQLRPTTATVAVAGNHDHWRDAGAIERTLRRHGVVGLWLVRLAIAAHAPRRDLREWSVRRPLSHAASDRTGGVRPQHRAR